MSTPALAVAAGMLTVGAPCVLPMLPVVMGASLGQQDRTRPLFIAAGFALAFAGVALLFTAFTHVLGVSQEALRTGAAVALMVFGLLMVWPHPFERLSVHASGVLNRAHALGSCAGSGKLGGMLLGLTLGVVWTPCAGPVLGSILTLLASEPATARTALLLACYALGAAVPMLAIAYGGQYAAARVRQLSRYTRPVQRAFGVVVIATALAMLLQLDGVALAWLSQFLPSSVSRL